MAASGSSQDGEKVMLALLQLLNEKRTGPDTRKRVVKSLTAKMLTPTSLAMLGRRLRDQNDDVCLLVFQHLKK